MKNFIMITALLVLSSVANLSATPILDVTRFPVSGANMDGMLVSVVYDDPNFLPSTSIWNTTGNTPPSGMASGNGWSLGFSGDDTFTPGAMWEFIVDSQSPLISSFTINAIPGDTVFDILDFSVLPVVGPNTFPNTIGSKRGWWQENKGGYDPINYTAGDGAFFSWAFNDPVNKVGFAAAGDLFGQLTITFNTPLAGSVFNFEVDTDNVSPVPEPATVMLLGIGLAGLMGINRRRKMQL